MNEYYDIHCHAMSIDHVPMDTLLSRVVDMAIENRGPAILAGLGLAIAPHTMHKILDSVLGEKKRVIDAIDVDEELTFEPFFENAKKIREVLLQYSYIDQDQQTNKDRLLPVTFTPLMMPFRDSGSFDEYNGTHNYTAFAPNTRQFRSLRANVLANLLKMEDEKCFILPFIGIDLVNVLDECRGGKNAINSYLKGLLDRFIVPLNARTSRQSVFDFYQSIKEKKDDDRIGIGIKLYPPIESGFSADGTLNSEINNVLIKLFELCAERCIPITTHAGKGGFVLSSDSTERGFDNARAILFDQAISTLPQPANLKINFAHLGGEKSLKAWESSWFETSKDNWTDDIVQEMTKFHLTPTVFGDLSYVCASLTDKCATFAIQQGGFGDQLLWGTDWPMSLMEKPTYKTILRDFLAELYKHKASPIFAKIAETNPVSFLF